MFQSTPSRRGRPSISLSNVIPLKFQSTPSRRGRPHRLCRLARSKAFQSTPSRRGRHVYESDPMLSPEVSIHALAKRATSFCGQRPPLELVSIHALAKRATNQRRAVRNCAQRFNPRPREEGDGINNDLVAATDSFNPRPREEGDSQALVARISTNCFNPRPREEGDSGFPIITGSDIVSIHALAKRATHDKLTNVIH